MPNFENSTERAIRGLAAANRCQQAAKTGHRSKTCRSPAVLMGQEAAPNPMQSPHLLDLLSAVIVVGGTVFATALRSGFEDCRLTLAAVASLTQPRFSGPDVRAVIAPMAARVRQDGLLRAQFRPLGDRAFDEVLAVLVQTRSIPAMIHQHATGQASRLRAAAISTRTLVQAAELGPVFGLAGTLISLSQLPAEGLARGMFMGAISMAVLSTLYGLLLANIVFAPLARAVERRAEAEEEARQTLFDWMVNQLEPEFPAERRFIDRDNPPRVVA
jgi:chemotaxis protein MotA